MRARLLFALPAIGLAACAAPSLDEARGTEPSAASLLERCAATYASCRTYRDRGSVADPGLDSAASFSTLFRRPSGLRFEHRGKHFGEDVSLLIRSSNGPAEVRWNDGTETLDTLQEALSVSNGLCDGAPCLIPSLLLPDVELLGLDLRRLEDLRRQADEPIDDTPCFRIEGAWQIPSPFGEATAREAVTLWIGKEDSLIRRVDTIATHPAGTLGDTAFPEITLESTFVYAPEIDGAVSDEDLGAP